MLYANNKGADQPAHQCSLISPFVVCCLDSPIRLICLVSVSEMSSLYLASVAGQAGLCLTWSQTPKTGFLMRRLIYFRLIKEKQGCEMRYTPENQEQNINTKFIANCSIFDNFISHLKQDFYLKTLYQRNTKVHTHVP